MMSGTPGSPMPGPNDDQSEDWLAGLAGIGTGIPTSPARREGEVVRRLLLDRVSLLKEAEQQDPNLAETHWDLVLRQIRAAQSFFPSESRVTSKRWSADARRHLDGRLGTGFRLALAGLVVSSVAVAVGYWLLPTNVVRDDVVAFRGDESIARISVRSGELEATLKSILGVLEQHQVLVHVQRADKRAQLQARIPPDSDASRALLKFGVQSPQHGRLTLIISEE
jgi:hypothetical protein